MAVYHFTVERSSAPEDQVGGLACDTFSVGGTYSTTKEEAAWGMAKCWCVVPGTYTITMRRGKTKLPSRRYVKKLILD